MREFQDTNKIVGNILESLNNGKSLVNDSHFQLHVRAKLHLKNIAEKEKEISFIVNLFERENTFLFYFNR